MNLAEAGRKPVIAVLLPTYNGARFLDEQISSLLWQTDVRVKIFLRDDLSTDKTPFIINALVRRYPDIVTVVEDGHGKGGAGGSFFHLIADLDAPEFDYVAFCDQDDIWGAAKMATAVAAIRAQGADAYSSNLIAFDASRAASWVIDKAQPERQFDYLFQGASAGCTYVLSAKAFSVVQAAVRTAGPIPAGTSHDWTVYAICRSHQLTWVRDVTAHIFYRQHSGNEYGARSGLKGLLARGGMVRSRWYRDHVVWLGAVLAMSPSEAKILQAVKRLNPFDRLALAFSAGQYRRGRRDRILLALSLMLGFF